MTAVGEAVGGCRSLCYSHGSTSGSSWHRQQRSRPANASRGWELAGVHSPPGQSVPAPQMLFRREFKELRVTIAFW